MASTIFRFNVLKFLYLAVS
ncbi:hypothetical protein BDFB_015129 [Asbolus verrucosus]|uniref:Uncharacterized protein n=1 Tax=Asbolus verrucosus TaxID=1661398 RepID=A0A482W4J4_ASBVE|nr:hypothetical protein BDFB_015129 [Asbolus verrucosus]